MIVALKGIVLDKIEKDNPKDNSKKLVLRLYQEGEKTNLDVTVDSATYGQAKKMSEIKLPEVKVGIYNLDGRVGMYAKQEF